MSRASRTTTSKPRSASSCAALRPATPPPRIATRVIDRRYTVEGVRVRRDQLVLGAVAAVVLAASSGVKTAPRPTPTPAPDRPLFGGSLEPGVRYRTRTFFPTLSFVVADTEWMADASPGKVVLQRRIRTDSPGSELPPRSSLSFRPTRPGRPTLHERMQRRPDLTVGS